MNVGEMKACQKPMLMVYCITNTDYYAQGRENSQNSISSQEKTPNSSLLWEKKKTIKRKKWRKLWQNAKEKDKENRVIEMPVLTQTKVQQVPDSASNRVSRRCLDKSTRTRQALCDTFPVHFPSFQQLVSRGLPELTGLSLNLISPHGFVSHGLDPVLRARVDLQHHCVP